MTVTLYGGPLDGQEIEVPAGCCGDTESIRRLVSPTVGVTSLPLQPAMNYRAPLAEPAARPETGRGRPPKAAAAPAEAPKPKRPRGRPRKGT